jgi:hypothetical protein
MKEKDKNTYLSKIEKDILNLEIKKRLSTKYNLSEIKTRWYTYLCIEDSSKATDVEFGRGCGCCIDSAYHAKPFFIERGIKIYIGPRPEMLIGHGEECSKGIRPYDPEVIKKLFKDYPPIILSKVCDFIKDNPPTWELDE